MQKRYFHSLSLILSMSHLSIYATQYTKIIHPILVTSNNQKIAVENKKYKISAIPTLLEDGNITLEIELWEKTEKR